jgi:sporulation protein YlmC with PRC-barrel domain
MASHDKHTYRLQELGGSDFEIVDGQPDIRGWDVKSASGQKLGEVDELIFDAQTRKVRYMVVDLDDNDELDLDDRDVLIPIGLAELHRDDDDVILTDVTLEQIRALPEYHENHLEPEVERAVCAALGRTVDAPTISNDVNADFYNHEHFKEDNLYRNRRGESTVDATGEDRSGAGRTNDYIVPTRSEENIRRDVPEEEGMLVNRNRLDDAEDLRLRNEQTERDTSTDEEWNRSDEDRRKRDERTGNTGL